MADIIHITRDGQTLGQFEPGQVEEAYIQGIFKETDMAWLEGTEEWRPLSEFFTPIPEEELAQQADLASSPHVAEEAAPEAQAEASIPEATQEAVAQELFSPTAPAAHTWTAAPPLPARMPKPNKNAFAEEKKNIFWLVGLVVVMLLVIGTVYFIFVK